MHDFSWTFVCGTTVDVGAMCWTKKCFIIGLQCAYIHSWCCWSWRDLIRYCFWCIFLTLILCHCMILIQLMYHIPYMYLYIFEQMRCRPPIINCSLSSLNHSVLQPQKYWSKLVTSHRKRNPAIFQEFLICPKSSNMIVSCHVVKSISTNL